MSRTLVPRRTRLDFDGGPWIAGFPLSWSSPWTELAVAGAVGFAAGLLFLPSAAPVQAIGWVGWLLSVPFAGLFAIGRWLLSGTFAWPVGQAALAPMGWALLSVGVADLLQAALPLTFGRRVLAAACAGPALAFGLIAGLSILPWHLLPWAG